uniref:WAT1-related protein n=1 Tax=Kalanchoe fedtschenkoi TaxID=63787 RepID=A0A7N0V0D7_KALFE
MGGAMDGLKPTFLMVLVQCSTGLVNILYKLALGNGMSARILIAYRFMFASAFVVPMSFILEGKRRPKMTSHILFQGFLCGLIGGTLGQSLYIEGLAYTSATFAAAMMNLVPAATFIISVIYGIERLSLTKIGMAKIIGTAIGVGGAMVQTFYKGPLTNPWTTNINLMEYFEEHGSTGHPQVKHNQLLGLLLSLASCFCYSVWLLIQAKMTQTFPYQYTITAMMSVSAAVTGVAWAICLERDWSAWHLGLNIRLLTVGYSGIIASGLMFSLMAWCVWKRGPLFVAVFNPLMLVFVAIIGSFCLDEKLHLGSLIGAVLIVIGLYANLWAKGQELKSLSSFKKSTNMNDEDSDSPGSQRISFASTASSIVI